MTEISKPIGLPNKNSVQSIPSWTIVIIGAIASVFIVYPTNFIATSIMKNPAALIVTVPVEEISKLLGVIYLVIKYPERLQDKNSGAILGGIAGLTFGIIEMVISGSGLLGLIFSTPLHVMCSGLASIGLVFSASKTQERSKSDYSVLFGNETLTFWLIAIALHFIYNLLAFSLKEVGVLIGLAAVLFVSYKLYHYLPIDLNNMLVPGPIKILSDAFSSSQTKKR